MSYGKTIYEQAAFNHFQEATEDPDILKTVSLYHQQLCKGEYPQAYVDVIFQKWRFPPDIYDAFSFALIHAGIREGIYGIFQIPIDNVPPPDAMIEKTNRILQTLPHPFYGEFWGGLADWDGRIGSIRPIHVLIQREGEVGFVILPQTIHFSDNGKRSPIIPLEVGYISAHKVKCFLGGCAFGIARWPYGHKRITVIIPSKYCIFANQEKFESVKEEVWGDFNSLPNPYNDEWK